jgi:hypothetical protein
MGESLQTRYPTLPLPCSKTKANQSLYRPSAQLQQQNAKASSHAPTSPPGRSERGRQLERGHLTPSAQARASNPQRASRIQRQASSAGGRMLLAPRRLLQVSCRRLGMVHRGSIVGRRRWRRGRIVRRRVSRGGSRFRRRCRMRRGLLRLCLRGPERGVSCI